VGEDFALRFEDHDPANERFFLAGKPGHRMFDIEAYVAHRLAAAGVTRIEALGEDTCSQPDRFFSYRRSCLKGEPGYGRQVSLIGLRD
jgi:copper oxidase (laccase) domain-containing protein